MKIFAFVFTIVLCLPRLLVPQPLPVVVGAGKTYYPEQRETVRNSQGWIYVVYTDSLSRIICKVSTDNGQTWPPNYYILNNTGPSVGGQAPALAVAKGDTLYAVWTQSYFDSSGNWGDDAFWSLFDGTNWSPMSNVNHQLSTGNISLVVDPSNQPHVVWEEWLAQAGVFYSRYNGASWTPPEMVTGGGAYMPSLAVDSAGNLHLAYYVGNVSYRKRVGGVWSASTVVGSGGRPCIAVDFLGHPHVVWTSFQQDILYSYFNDTTWSAPLNLSNNAGASYYSTISCDSRNNIYVAWNDNSLDTTKLPRIFYRTFDGSSWAPTSVISADTVLSNVCPNIGYPVTDSGVDVVWTNSINVVYLRLPLVVNGVEGENQKALNVESLKLNVQSPARHELSASYSLPSQSKVSLILYDLSGRKVMVLDEGEKPTGRYQVRRSLGLPAGVYFLRLVSGREALTRKVVVIR